MVFYNKKKSNPKELELTYEINAGIPFKWVYEIEDKDVVEFVKSYVVRDDNKGGKVGASVYTNYVFKGLKEGETTITFKVVSITGEREDANHEVHRVKVDKDLNISLIDEQLLIQNVIGSNYFHLNELTLVSVNSIIIQKEQGQYEIICRRCY